MNKNKGLKCKGILESECWLNLMLTGIGQRFNGRPIGGDKSSYIYAAHLPALFFTRFDKVVGILPVFQKVLIRSVQNSHPHVTKLLLKEILDVSAHVEYVRHSCTQREYIAINRVSTKSRIVFSFIKSN